MQRFLTYAAVLPVLLFLYALIQSNLPFLFLLLVYMVWLLMILIPAIAAFGFQCFACNTTKSPILRLIPTVTVLAIIIFECLQPFYSTYLHVLSAMLGLTHYLIIPVVLLGLLAGWIVLPS